MTVSSLCLLVRAPFEDPENGTELARAALAEGLGVHLGVMDTLALHAGSVACRTHAVTVENEAVSIVSDGIITPLQQFDHVQVLSFGHRATYLDKIQLLRLLAESTHVANSPDALMHLNSKYFMAGMNALFPGPQTYASSDAEYLWSVVLESGRQWIVKPPAEAFGRDVFLIDAHAPNARAILQSMTGHGAGRYCLLQEYIPAIRQGEKRVLLAGGRIMGQYLRRSAGDHRTNLAQGAAAEPCSLTSDEIALCERLAPWLAERGVAFAGIDLVYPYIIECNVLSPGGIRTIRELTGADLARPVLRAMLGL